MATDTVTGHVVHVCKHLRTKALFTPDARGNRALVEPSPTAHYWCNRSGTGIGPDNDFVSPAECDADRACYISVPLLLVESDEAE